MVVLILPLLRLDVALGQPLIQKRLDQARVQPQHIGHEILQIDDLHAVVAQDLRKCVMLLLRYLQKRNVIEQQLAQTVRRQVQQLPSRPVQKDFFERFDLAPHTNSFHSSSNHASVLARRAHRRRAVPAAMRHFLRTRLPPQSAAMLFPALKVEKSQVFTAVFPVFSQGNGIMGMYSANILCYNAKTIQSSNDLF